MKNAFIITLSVLIGGIIIMPNIGCSRKSHNTITLAGSTAFQPFAEKLAEHYLSVHKDIHINVQGGGSAVGVQSALAGTADIGMADLLKLPDEANALNSIIVARDGIAIVVNPQNQVNALTSAQAHDIFSGKTTNWKGVGGQDANIRVVSREEGSGTRRSFDKLVLGEDKLIPSALFQNSNGTIRETIASDSGAIGYLSIGLVDNRVKAVSYNGIIASNENVKKSLYPLARPIYFLTKKETSEATRKFIDYILSNEAQDILEKEGLIAVK